MEYVRQYYDHFNQKQWQGMLGLLADDVVHDLNQDTREQGRAAFQVFLETMNRHYDETLFEICLMSSHNGNSIAAEFICTR